MRLLSGIVLFLAIAVLFSSCTNSSAQIIFPGHSMFPVPLLNPVRQKFTSLNRPICALIQIRQNIRNTIDNSQHEYDGPCEQDDEYDQSIEEKFNNIIRASALNGITQDQNLRRLLEGAEPEREVDTRFGLDDFSACRSKPRIMQPRRGKTMKNEWVFVLNQGEMKQTVHTEVCESEMGPCDIGEIDAAGKTYCEQKYVYKKMVTMDKFGQNVVVDSIKTPSCCVCKIRRNPTFVLPRIKPTINNTLMLTTPTQPVGQPPVTFNNRNNQNFVNSRNIQSSQRTFNGRILPFQ